MANEYLDNITIDGLEETFGTNVDVEEVLSSNAMLVKILVDGSTSMERYEDAMRDCLEHYRSAISNSKQADEMLVSKTEFSSNIRTGGYVVPADFDTSYHADGCTKLYDAIVEGRRSMMNYMEQLRDAGTNVRAVMVILTDGWDVGSQCSIGDARQAVRDMISKEITVAFIAFGPDAFGIADKLGIKKQNVLNVSNDESELRRVMALVSKSAISASKKASSGASGSGDSGFFDI